MASAVEQLASNLNFKSFAKATELKQRILFTFAALFVFRIGTYIPIPGINTESLKLMMNQHSSGVLGMFNVFAGGAIGRMAIFALGIMPYISASIIVQLLVSIVPSLEGLKKEGNAGKKVIMQYTRYGALLLSVFQAYGISLALEAGMGTSYHLVIDPGWIFRFSVVTTLVGGTIFLMWLSEQITNRGIGNGSSLIIFSGIVAQLPSAFFRLLTANQYGNLSVFAILTVMILVIAVVFVVVCVERAQRRLLVQYPKRQMGNKIYQGESSHLPLKLNTAGVIPPIFASSLLMLPATINNFSHNMPKWLQNTAYALGHGQPLYIVVFAALSLCFCFFYTSVVFNPLETAEQLKKQSGFIPGYRPGVRTAEYIDYVLTRVTAIGALYITVICLLPEIVRMFLPIVPFQLGGTSLLIVVTVTLDTVGQIQGYLMTHQYENLIRKAKLRKGKK